LQNGFSIFPLGDAAASISLGNQINEFLNEKVIAMQQWMVDHPFEGQLDLIPAYCSLTVIYNPGLVKRRYQPSSTVFEWVENHLRRSYEESMVEARQASPLVEIPVCYDAPFAPDLEAMALAKGISTEEIIQLHLSGEYRVYTIGFLPGFSYMAPIHEKLVMPRKPRPVPVTAGSIGIAGHQTGIYPLNSPGGWHIIGRTPIMQFDPDAPEMVKLKVGDRVSFYRIGTDEMLRLEGKEDEKFILESQK